MARIVLSDVKFEQALKQEACDVVDAMLLEGYVPKPDSIIIVCRQGNIDLLTTLLRYDMDLQTGLSRAVFYGHIDLLKHLYLAGANVNLPRANGDTSLHYVRDEETCKWLLEMGAQQISNNDGFTPLHKACEKNLIGVVKLLLSHNQGNQGVQSILLRNEYGNTPLYYVSVHGNVEMAKLLLSYEQGVQSISMADIYGNRLLTKICIKGYTNVAKLLLSYEQGVQSITQGNQWGKNSFTYCLYLQKHRHSRAVVVSRTRGR